MKNLFCRVAKGDEKIHCVDICLRFEGGEQQTSRNVFTLRESGCEYTFAQAAWLARKQTRAFIISSKKIICGFSARNLYSDGFKIREPCILKTIDKSHYREFLLKWNKRQMVIAVINFFLLLKNNN